MNDFNLSRGEKHFNIHLTRSARACGFSIVLHPASTPHLWGCLCDKLTEQTFNVGQFFALEHHVQASRAPTEVGGYCALTSAADPPRQGCYLIFDYLTI